jgi:acetyl esterase/lipase
LLAAGLLLSAPAMAAGIVLHYGTHPVQSGNLYLPAGKGPHPLLMLLHGGCWQARIATHEYLARWSGALAQRGWAVWNVEYRSVDNGGGWPATFLDVAAAADYTRTLAARYPLDLRRLVFAGHSAGGHLALWAAGRGRIPAGSVLHAVQPQLPHKVIALAAITDLAGFMRDGGPCGSVIPALQGPATLAEVSPLQMLPLPMPVTLIQVADDAVIPAAQAASYRQAVQALGMTVRVRTLAGGGHFAAVATDGEGWQVLLDELAQLPPTAHPP